MSIPAPELGLSPGSPAVPPPKSGPLARLLAILRPDRADIWTVVVFAVVTGVLLLATPVAVQALVNFVAFGGATPPLVVVSFLLLLGLAFVAAMSATQNWVVEMIQRRVFVRLVERLTTTLPRVTLRARGHGYSPELVNRFFDVITIQKVGSSLLLDGLSALLSVLVGLIVLAFYHPLLLAFDVVLMGVIVALVFVPARRGVRTAIEESQTKYEVAAWLEEIARSPIAFKFAGAERWAIEESDRRASRFVEHRRAHYKVVFRQIVAALCLQALASTALLAVGGFLVMEGSLTLGQLVAAELIVTMVVAAVAKLGKHLEGFYDLLAAVDKIGKLLDLPTEPRRSETLPDETRPLDLELRELRCPGPAEGTTLGPLSLSLEAGRSLGLQGSSGAGKSLLLETFWGLRRALGGQVLLDGRDVRDLDPDSLRRAVGLVQRPEVVLGTLRRNLTLGRPGVGDDDIRSALADTGLDAALARLPDGLDTELSPDGYPLSMGEVQCLAVARVLAGRPRLVLFDGSLDRVPDGSRRRILDSLFSGRWTLVVASNDPSVLERCDRRRELSDPIPHPAA